jgi:TP901 family phage tail tape measure protein
MGGRWLMAEKAALRLDLIEDVFKNLDKAYEKAVQINAELDKFSEKAPPKRISEAWGDMAETTKKLSEAMKKVNTGGKFFTLARNLSEGIKLLAAAPIRETYYDNLFGALIDRLVTQSAKIKQLNTGKKFITLTENLKIAVKNISGIPTGPALTKIGKVGEMMSGLEKAIVGSSNAVDVSKKQKAMQATLTTVKTFGDIIKKVVVVATDVTSKIPILGRIPKAMKSVFSSFSLPRFGRKTDKSSIVKLRETLQSIGELGEAFGKLPKEEISDTTIESITRTLPKLLSLLDEIPRSSASKRSIAAIDSVSNFLKTVFSIFKDSASANTNVAAGLTALESLFTRGLRPFFRMMGNFFSEFEGYSWLKWRRSIVRFGKFMKNAILPMTKLLEVVSRGTEAADIGKVFTEMRRLVSTMVRIMMQLENFGRFSGLPFGKLRRTFNRLKKLLHIMMEPLRISADPEKITAVAGFLKEMTQMMEKLMKFIKLLEKTGMGLKAAIVNSWKIRILLNAVVKAMSNVAKSLRKVPSGTIKNLSAFLRGFGQVMNPLRFMMKQAAEINFAKATVLMFKMRAMFNDFGKMLSNLIKPFKKINPAKMKSLTALLEAVGGIMKRISTVMKQTAKAMSGDESSQKALRAGIDGVEDYIRLIGKLVKQFDPLKKIRGGKLKHIVGIVKGLPELLNVLSSKKLRSSGSDNAIIKVPQLDGEKLSKLLETISKLRIDRGTTNKVETLSLLMKALSDAKSSGADLGLSGVGNEIDKTNDKLETTESTLKDIRKGVFQGVIAAKLFEEAFGLVVKGVKTLFKLLSGTSVVNAMRNLSSSVVELGDKIRDIGERARESGQQLIESFGVGRLFGSQAFGDATEFDAIGKQLEVFGGLTSEAREEAEAFAFEIGKQYPLSANEALAATLDLVKAGQSLEDTAFILPAAADLAALSDSGDLGMVTETLIAAASGFEVFSEGIEGSFENIAEASNLISAGADVSTASVESIAQGLANVGPAANAFGLSLEETIAVLSIFDQNAIKGAEGGTALRSMLNALGSEKTIRNLDKLGISMFDPETGTRKGLNDIINEIGSAMEDMNPEQKAAAMQNLADTFGRQGLQVLLNQGQDGIDNMVESMDEVAPASERAQQMLESLSGQITQLRGSFETLLTKALLPLIDKFMMPFVKLARWIVDGFLAMNDSVLEFISTMVALVSIGATVVGGFLIFGGVLLQVGGLLFIFLGSMLNVVNVFFLVAGGITAAVTAFFALAAIFAFVVPVLIAITAAFEGMFKIFNEDLGGASTAVKTFLLELKAVFQDVFGGIGKIFSTIIEFLDFGMGDTQVNALERIGQGIASLFNKATEILRSGAIGDLRKFITGLGDIIDTAKSIFFFDDELEKRQERLRKTMEDLGESPKAVEDAVLQLSKTMHQEMYAAVTDLIDNNELIRKVLGDRRTFQAATEFFGQLSAVGIQASKDLTGIALDFKKFAINVRRFGLSKSVDFLKKDLNQSMGELFATLMDGFQKIFRVDLSKEIATARGKKGFAGALPQLFDHMIDDLKKKAIANRKDLKKVFSKVMTYFLSPIKAIGFFGKLFGIDALSNFADSFNSMLEKAFGQIFDFFFNLLEGMGFRDAAIDAFGEAITPILDFVHELGRAVGFIFDYVWGVVQSLFSLGEGAGGEGGIVGAVSGIFEKLADFLKGVNDLVLKPLSEGHLLLAVSNLVPLVFDLIVGVGAKILDALSGIDLPQVFLEIGAAIANLIFTALGSGIESFGDLLNVDVTSILSTIDQALESNLTALEAGGVGGVFTLASSTIFGLFISAVELAFATLEGIFDIDTTKILADIDTAFGGLLDAFENIFLGSETDPSIFDNIITIVNNVVEAIKSFFALFAPGGEGEEVDEGKITSTSSALQFFVDVLGALVALGIDTLTSFVNGIDDLFDNLAEADPETIFALAGAIVALGVSFYGLGASLTFLKTKLAFLAGLLGTIVTIFVGIVALKSLADNVDTLFDAFEDLVNLDIAGFFGDLTQFLGDFLTDIGFTIIELFGLEDAILDVVNGLAEFLGLGAIADNWETLVSQVKTTINQISFLMELAVTNFMSKAGNAIEESILDIRSRFATALHDLGLEEVGFGDAALVETRKLFEKEEISWDDLIEFRQEGEWDTREFARFAKFNVEKLTDTLMDAIESGDVNEIFQAAQVFSDTGIADDLIENLFFKEDFDSASALIEHLTPDPESAKNIIQSVQDAVLLGAIDEAQGVDVLNTLFKNAFLGGTLDASTLGLFQEQLGESEVNEQLQAYMVEYLGGLGTEVEAHEVIPLAKTLSTILGAEAMTQEELNAWVTNWWPDMPQATRQAIIAGMEDVGKEDTTIGTAMDVLLDDINNTYQEAVAGDWLEDVGSIAEEKLTNSVYTALKAGVDPEQISAALAGFGDNLTSEQIQTIWFNATTAIEEELAAAAENDPIKMPVTVEPTEVTVPLPEDLEPTIPNVDEDGALVIPTFVRIEPTEDSEFDEEAVQQLIDDGALTAEADIDNLTDPDEVAELNEELTILTTRLTLIQEEFTETQTLFEPFLAEFNEVKEAISATTIIYGAFLALLMTSAAIGIPLYGLAFKMWILDPMEAFGIGVWWMIIQFPIMAAAIAAGIAVIGASGGLGGLASDANELKVALDGVAIAATAAAAALGALLGTGNGDGVLGGLFNFGGGREFGGPVKGNTLYEVIEGGKPELLEQNGKTYLMPGSDGHVIPATALAMTGTASTPSVPQSSQTSYGAQTINIDMGGVIIGDISGSDLDTGQIVAEADRALRASEDRLRDEFSVNDQLRSRHRR